MKKMLKKDYVSAILEQVESIDNFNLLKVYGCGCGVGYDFNIDIRFKDNQVITLPIHAMNKSWCLPGHLRVNTQVEFIKYTGSNDVYRDDVRDSWYNSMQEGKYNEFEEYLSRFKKDELIDFYNDIITVTL